MNYKKILPFVIVIVIFIAGFFAVYYYRNSLSDNTQKQENNLQTQTIVLEEKTIRDTEKPFDITVVYPHVEGLDDFNKKSEDTVQKELSEFKKISLDKKNRDEIAY